MKSTICKLMAMCFLATSLVAFAQSSSGSQDEMKKDDAMKQDSMKKDDMSKEEMKKGKKTKKDKKDKKDKGSQDDVNTEVFSTAVANSTNIRLSNPRSPRRVSIETSERGRFATLATMPINHNESASALWAGACRPDFSFSSSPSRIRTTSRRFTLRVAVRGNSSSVKCSTYMRL